MNFTAGASKVAFGLLGVLLLVLAIFVRNYTVNAKELAELRYLREVAELQGSQIQDLYERYLILEENYRQIGLSYELDWALLEGEGIVRQSYSDVAETASSLRVLRTASRDSKNAPPGPSAIELSRVLYVLQETAYGLEEDMPFLEEQACAFHDEAVETADRLKATPSIWPTRGNITSEFGMRRHPITYVREMHEGLDIGASMWTDIQVTADGKVTFSGYKSGYGYMVTVSHGYGYETLYAHCVSLKAKVGQEVKRGDVIAYVGQSGVATGPHVHYEVRIWGTPVNPRDFLPG